MGQVAASVIIHGQQFLVPQLAADFVPILPRQFSRVGNAHFLQGRHFQARFEDGPKGDQIGVGAAEGLDIGVITAE